MHRFIRRPNDLDGSTISKLFERARFFLNQNPRDLKRTYVDRTAVLAFFEPSTRTRVGFEIAGHRLGVRAVVFGSEIETSLSKGESVYESLKTIQQMQPDLIVTRTREPLAEVWPESSIPLINGGDGTEHHPTQALTDLFTLDTEWPDLKGKRVLLVGDLRHSRVANSNCELLSQFGVELGLAAPEELEPVSSNFTRVKRRFHDFSEALQWADAVMLHRYQRERHTANSRVDPIEFQLNSKTLEFLRKEAIIMHPGPFNLGVELTGEVLQDSRCRIHTQVANSVPVRMALMEYVLGETQ